MPSNPLPVSLVENAFADRNGRSGFTAFQWQANLGAFLGFARTARIRVQTIFPLI